VRPPTLPRTRSGAVELASVALVIAVALGALLSSAPPQAAARRAPHAKGHLTSTSSARRPPRHKARRASHAKAAARFDDGSLGDRSTRVACTLLTRAQIASQFGGPVGVATPTYPYCQWLVGSGGFFALAVEPGVSFAEATSFVVPVETLSGIGSAAMIANNRYLYFASGDTSYWLLYQQVGYSASLDTRQLSALAGDVLRHGLPRGKVGLPPLPPAGPPVYFAGDSTAAGPEWAWVTYHATTAATATLAEYQVGSGFVVPAYFDWARHLVAVTAARRPRLVIWMGSANDGQSMLIDGAVQAVGSPAWRAAYGAIVGSTMAALLREGAKVLWIGQPAMQDPQLSAEMQVVDQVYAAEAAKHRGVYYFDPGTVLDGPGRTYTGSLVIDGKLTPVRLDGIHLNIYGSLYLADKLAPIIDSLLGVRPAP
jgi:hypothetical protein